VAADAWFTSLSIEVVEASSRCDAVGRE